MPRASQPSALLSAAAALDTELTRFAELVTALERLPLASQRALERAARTTDEAAQSQARVAENIQALIAALQTAREDNEQKAAVLTTRAREIAARRQELQALEARFVGLGEEAGRISADVAELGRTRSGADGPAERAETVALLEQVEGRMVQVVEGAESLGHDAQAADFEELRRQTDALRQQVLSARNKVSLLRQKLAAELPRPRATT